MQNAVRNRRTEPPKVCEPEIYAVRCSIAVWVLAARPIFCDAAYLLGSMLQRDEIPLPLPSISATDLVLRAAGMSVQGGQLTQSTGPPFFYPMSVSLLSYHSIFLCSCRPLRSALYLIPLILRKTKPSIWVFHMFLRFESSYCLKTLFLKNAARMFFTSKISLLLIHERQMKFTNRGGKNSCLTEIPK